MAVFPEEARRANDNVQAINTSLDRELGITHVTTDVLWNVSRCASGRRPRSATHVSDSWPMRAVSRHANGLYRRRKSPYLEAELADSLAVLARLLGRSG